MFLREQKLASGSVHGCTLPDRLFSKALEAAHLRFKRRALRLLFRILTAETRCRFGKLLTGLSGAFKDVLPRDLNKDRVGKSAFCGFYA